MAESGGAGMSVLVVVIFDEVRRTSDYVQSLRALHDQGRVSVYAIAMMERGPRGVAPRMPVGSDEAVAGPAVGAAMGALVSLLDGPLQAAARAVPHSLIGAMRDLDDAGLDPGFLEQVSRDLPVGGGAVLSQLEELQPLIIDTLGLQHGGRVFRQRLAAVFAERRLVATVGVLRQELLRIQARNRPGEPESVITTAYRTKGIELASAVRRAKSLAAALRRERAAKAQSLEAQAERLADAPRQAILRRSAALQAALQHRAELLERAVSLAEGAKGRASPFISPESTARDS
jgi:uncharacterized membrane protein